MRNLSSQMIAVLAMSLGFSLTSHGAEPQGELPLPPMLSPEATDALLSIDGVPSPTQLESLIPGQTLNDLLAIAAYPGRDTDNPEKDAQQALQRIPIRLRAIRAASLFELAPDTNPQIPMRREALMDLLNDNRATESGAGVLIIQAALESLGRVGSPEHSGLVLAVQSSLTHPNRDVRIAAARALRQMGASSARDALRARWDIEPILAVKLALSEAIQALGSSSGQPTPALQ